MTFLFTDVVGSTAAWEADPRWMADALGVHDEVLLAAFDAHGGYVFATVGDGFAVAFQRADDAVAAGVAGQRGLRDVQWPHGSALTVRMGAHTGETVERDGDYFGPAVNRAARVMDAASGGQFVITSLAERDDPDLALECLRDAVEADRRTASPFLATDVCVAVAHVALRLGRPEVALFAVGAVEPVGQRTTGAFGWRRSLEAELDGVVDDEMAAELRREGAEFSPRAALAEAVRRLE